MEYTFLLLLLHRQATDSFHVCLNNNNIHSADDSKIATDSKKWKLFSRISVVLLHVVVRLWQTDHCCFADVHNLESWWACIWEKWLKSDWEFFGFFFLFFVSPENCNVHTHTLIHKNPIADATEAVCHRPKKQKNQYTNSQLIWFTLSRTFAHSSYSRRVSHSRHRRRRSRSCNHCHHFVCHRWRQTFSTASFTCVSVCSPPSHPRTHYLSVCLSLCNFICVQHGARDVSLCLWQWKCLYFN